MTAYTGYLTRMAHYSAPRDTAPGVNPEHTHPEPDPDIFDPRPAATPDQGGDVWNPTENGFTSGDQVQPVRHWYNGQLAVPTNVPYGTAQQAMQDRMMVDHSDTNFRPDGIRLYQHATEGETIDYEPGRMPWNAGQTLPEDVQYLANGDNSYDQINQPNEVYGGDPANVGRYRLGARWAMFGLYENPHGKFGQDANLRAYTGLTPQFPDTKTQHNQDAAPYTPNSSGTATWVLPQFQVPRLFSLPSETSLTDYTVASEDASVSSPYASDDGRL
jgi:hypothetical protein